MCIPQAGTRPLTDLGGLLEWFGALRRRIKTRHVPECYSTRLLANILHATGTAVGEMLPRTNTQRLHELLKRTQRNQRPWTECALSA